jgi:hypothetical protein
VTVALAERHQLLEIVGQLEAAGLDLDQELVEAARNHGRQHPAVAGANATERVRRALGDHRHRARAELVDAPVAPDLVAPFEDLERLVHAQMDVPRRAKPGRRRLLPHCEIAAGLARRHAQREHDAEHVHFAAFARPGDGCPLAHVPPLPRQPAEAEPGTAQDHAPAPLAAAPTVPSRRGGARVDCAPTSLISSRT